MTTVSPGIVPGVDRRPATPRLQTTAAVDGPLISWKAVLAYVLVAAVYFLPAFLPEKQIGGTDYFAGGYFFLEFATKRLAGGALPKWVPYVFGGLPMYANPGSTYYPLRLLYGELLPLDRVLVVLFITQFAIAGIGMHLLLRALGLRAWTAFVGGLAFEFSGVAMSYVFAGQDGRIIGATFTPLVFFLVYRGVQTRQIRWFVGLSVALGTVLLSFQLQSAYYLMLAAGLWGLFLIVRDRHALGWGGAARCVGLGAASAAFAFSLAAIDILPFIGYIASSPRAATANRDYEFSTQFSMPPVETIGLAVPEQAGILFDYHGPNPFKLHTEYVGALAVLLLAISIGLCWRDAVWRFFGGLALFALSICYGAHTPIYKLYYALLPGTNKFRSPSIALFLVAFSVVVMAALALERLAAFAPADRNPETRKAPRVPAQNDRAKRWLSALTVVTAVAALLVMIVGFDRGGAALGWTRFLCFLFAVCQILRLWMGGRLSRSVTMAILALVTVVDLWWIDQKFFDVRPAPDIAFAPDSVVDFLSTQQPGRVWVFPFPTNDISAVSSSGGSVAVRSDYLMHFGFSQVGGEHGNQLQRWNELLGVGPNGSIDWHNLSERPVFLNAIGVRYIVSRVPMQLFDVERDQPVAGLHLVWEGSAFIYRNDAALPLATLVPSVQRVANASEAMTAMRTEHWDPRQVAIVEGAPSLPVRDHVAGVTEHSAGSVRVTAFDPDHISVQVNATEPAMLVLTENYADGWVARIDGRETPILRTNYTLRGVPVPAGDHQVSFDFEPRPFYTGAWISAVSWLAVLIAGASALVVLLRRSRSSARQTARPVPAHASRSR
jgi:hypothetical protein